ncbi:orotate phosphoribosyltransferase [Umbelopsis sp. WA50703]|jgi:orotate phosphoribosyltransferase
MKDYQREFIEFCLANDVLKFGSFTLKSGRVSPYFFNAGLFNSGKSITSIGRFYSAAIIDQGFKYDVLFGPAYKGIPLVVASSIALYNEHQIDAPYSFNRKEKKDHGEGGSIVGTPLVGEILVVDDVITAGTAINESIEIIKQANAKLSGVIVAVDRAEVAPDGSGKSAIQAVEEKNGVPVSAIITMDHIIEYMSEKGTYGQELEQMKEYKAQYGVKK